jgi:hypothetical protein
VRIVVDKEALGQVFLRVFRFYPLIIIPTTIHIYFHLRVDVTRRTNGRNGGELDIKISLISLFTSLKSQNYENNLFVQFRTSVIICLHEWITFYYPEIILIYTARSFQIITIEQRYIYTADITSVTSLFSSS